MENRVQTENRLEAERVVELWPYKSNLELVKMFPYLDGYFKN